MARVQTLLSRYEGTLNKIVTDDTGVILVIGYGLPPHAHEDDAVRAVRTASALREYLRERGLSFGIGVTTGRAFCGTCGSERRREYTMLGDSVNLSARLMATARNDVLCDQRTVLDSLERVAFIDLPPVSVKGKTEPVPVASPAGALDLTGRHEVLLTGRHETLMTGRFDAAASSTAGFGALTSLELPSALDASQVVDTLGPAGDAVTIIGRETERELLEERVRQLDTDGRKGIVVLEAEAGFGKSLLGAWLHGVAIGMEVVPLLGASEPSTRADAWHPFRQVFAQLLGLDTWDDPAFLESAVLSRLEGRPRLLAWAPLLADLLPIALAPNETTERMVGVTRADALREVLAALLRVEAERTPQLVLLEDTHWMDATSWSFVQTIVRSVDRVLLVLITRPMGEQAPPELVEVLARPDCDHLVLDTLTDDQIVELARTRLQVDALPREIATAITKRAEGNPFFAQELTFALVDSGVLLVTDGFATLSGPAIDIDLPDTLQGVVTSRLDRLDPRHGLTAKVASVIGRTFGERLLAEVHPQPDMKLAVHAHLEALEEAEVAEPETDTAEPDWAFRHVIYQETAYSLLPFSQRRELHADVARWYEGHSSDEAATGPLLAWHWRRAEELDKAVDVLERVGAAAVRRGADSEGLALLDEALELDAQRQQPSPPARVASWHSLRGDALVQSGDMVRSKATYAQALELLRFRLPGGALGWAWMLVRELVKQLRHRFLPARRRQLPEPVVARSAAAASLYSKWSATAYFTIEPLHWFLGGLAAINLADRTGDDQPVGQALGSFGNVVGALKLQKAAMHYFDRCRSIQDARDRTVGAWGEAVFHITYVRLEPARTVVQEGIDLGERTADRYTLGLGWTIRGLVSWLEGKLEDSAADNAEVLATSRQRTNTEHESWALTFGTPVLLALGRDQLVEQNLRETEAILDHLDPFTHVGFHGVRALLRSRRGDHDGALADAAEMVTLYAKHPLALFTHLPGFGGAGEAVLRAWAAAEAGAAVTVPDGWTLHKLVKKTLALTNGGALSFLYFRPRKHLLAGTKAWIAGKQAAARKQWSRGLELAEELGLPYEAALLALEVALHVPSEAPEARRRLEELGATGHLARLDAAGGTDHPGPQADPVESS